MPDYYLDRGLLGDTMAVHETTKLKKEYLKAMPNHLCIAAKKNEFIYYTINYNQPPSARDSREFITETND